MVGPGSMTVESRSKKVDGGFTTMTGVKTGEVR